MNSKKLLVKQGAMVTGLIAVAIAVTGLTARSITTDVALTQVYDGATATDTVIGRSTLTADKADKYQINNYQGDLFVQAPSTNTGSNLRMVMWPNNSPQYLNSQVCATWVGQTHKQNQEGLALRITKTATGATRAITVTKNVIFNADWTFNIHTWDSSNTKSPFTQLAQFPMGKVVTNKINQREYMPWRVCARVVDSTFTFKVWLPDKMAEPAWDDPIASGSVAIPSDYMSPGYSGWYIGHIPASGNVEYNNLQIWTIQ